MSTFDKLEFGKRLKNMRVKAGYTRQIDLAEKLGTVVQTISNYESGKRLPDAEMLARIVQVLPCNADYLLGFEDKPTYSEAYITEETGLLSGAVKVLCDNTRLVREKCYTTRLFGEKEEGDGLLSQILSNFITSAQFQPIVNLHKDCVGFVCSKRVLEHGGEEDALDEIDRMMLDLFRDQLRGIGDKSRYELYMMAAKHQAMDLYGEFYDHFAKLAEGFIQFIHVDDEEPEECEV